MPLHDVLIIGAGLSGLTAASKLAAEGKNVLVIDKGRSVGGRLATRRIDDAIIDHGAQFFTARSPEFGQTVASWLDAGIVAEWCRGFGEDDGYPRYRSNGGMNQLAKFLQTSLPDCVEVVNSASANAVLSLGDHCAVTYEGSSREPDEAAALIITSPVPQTMALLDAGGFPLPGEVAEKLRQIRYHSVIALLAKLDGPAPFGPVGALQQPNDPVFTFCADNQAKGISESPAATFHVAHELSVELFDQSDDEILSRLRPAAEALLGAAQIESLQLKKWRYAGPVEPWPERTASVGSDLNPVVLCGDAFGGPKVEGAYLSGVAAAEAILHRTQ